MAPVIGSPPVNATNIGVCEAHNAAPAARLAGAADVVRCTQGLHQPAMP